MTPAYKNPHLPVTTRVQDLLSRMSLEEKAAQMRCVWQQKSTTLVDADGRFDAQKARAAFGNGHGIGQVGRPSDAGGGLGPRQNAELTNAIQRFMLEESRLGIPVFFHEECLHGQAAPDATQFPQPIALASTFNPALAEAIYAATAAEARSRGTHQALTPVLDIARDPRWGRVEETFGEDPFLVAEMAKAAVRGFQGDAAFTDGRHVVATLKHFAAHGQPEGGMNCGPVNVSERELRDVFLEPFRAAVREGAVSVMASYNEIDGVPSHANRWLLHDVLRDEWGFRGYVVSDYYAIWELNHRPDTHGHHVAADKREACALAVRAGVNVELPEPDAYLHLEELVREGILEESRLDELVAPLLHWKFAMGLFDDPFVDPDAAEAVVGSEPHRALARQAARESIILLKNENDLLPLDPDGTHTIAVIGPNSDRSLLGGYSGVPRVDVGLLEGLRARAGNRVRILHARGCGITEAGSWNQDSVILSDPAEDDRLLAEAEAIAREADLIVLAIGGNEQTSREAWSRFHMGDRADLTLLGRQEELVRRMLATGKPVVAVLYNGRPLAVNLLADRVPAVLECWYLGQENGHAAADVLFGDASPGGKLPISFPRSVGHIPVFYNHKPSARRGYLFDDVSPLFPFGYGLSYTTFSLGSPRLERSVIGPDESTRVHVDITNTGRREGSEVVQLYVRDRVSSVTRPVKELKGFKRMVLQPGETATVTLDITPDTLAFHTIDFAYRVEPGEFDLLIGTSSQDDDLQRVTLRVA